MFAVYPFMVWNLYLAVVPAVLALVLFRRHAHVGVGWFIGLVVWLVFLPNAPYVLTDVVHMPADLRASLTHAHAYLVVLTYALFFAAGLLSYVVSLKLFSGFLRRVTKPQFVLPILLVVHGLCVVAMYLGRVMRLNSWDVVFAPRTVLASLLRVPHPHTVVILATMFLIVGVGAYVMAAVGHTVLEQVRRITAR